MNRHLEFDQEFLARLKALFLTKFAVVPAGTILSYREERSNGLIRAFWNNMELADVVDKLGIPRPENGNLMQALFKARPRIVSRSQWGDVEIIACRRPKLRPTRFSCCRHRWPHQTRRMGASQQGREVTRDRSPACR